MAHSSPDIVYTLNQITICMTATYVQSHIQPIKNILATTLVFVTKVFWCKEGNFKWHIFISSFLNDLNIVSNFINASIANNLHDFSFYFFFLLYFLFQVTLFSGIIEIFQYFGQTSNVQMELFMSSTIHFWLIATSV